jgi:hypothetical protein
MLAFLGPRIVAPMSGNGSLGILIVCVATILLGTNKIILEIGTDGRIMSSRGAREGVWTLGSFLEK